MKNCELFKTEEELQKKWELRQKLAPNTPEGLTFVQWACYNDADLALQDQFLKPGLFIRENNEYVLVSGPRPDSLLRDSLVYVNYTNRYGNRGWDSAESLKQCTMPPGIMDLAKALVLEELKAKCPLFAKEGQKGC